MTKENPNFKMKTQKLILIRGASGSGKTTKANELLQNDPDLKHFEADMFFIKNGEYKFDFTKLKDAHFWCQNSVRESLNNGHSVIVSNTFTKRWEVQPYLDMANEFEIPVEIIRMTGEYQNVHGCPEDKVKKMREGYEEIDISKQ